MRHNTPIEALRWHGARAAERGETIEECPCTLQEIERTITFADDDSGDHTDEHDAGPVTPATFAEALDALNGGCWDNLDERGDGTIIAYPADSSQDLATGAYTQTQLIVKFIRPELADELVELHRAGN